MSNLHYHQTEAGILVKCYHGARSLFTDWRFWLGTTMSFPLEHFIWEKIWPLNLLTHWLGL